MTPAPAVRYRFGPFELDVRDHRLSRDGVAVSITPKAFETLRVLIERVGHLVEKEDLMREIWPGSFVEEANLAVQISTIRKALGESGGRAAYIETVPTRGYRFIAPVETLAAPAAGPGERPADVADTRIIVLPLRLLASDPRTDFLAFALPDALAGSLARQPSLAVHSPVVAQRHGGAGADIAALATSADVDFVLTGTLATVAGEPRITLQLLECRGERLRWSESVSAPAERLFALQEDLAVRVARVLSGRHPQPPDSSQATDAPADAAAYVFYLRANHLAYETNQWAQARDLYLQCLHLDRGFAPAWARLARCYRVLGKFAATAVDGRDNWQLAEKAFERALSLNPDLSLAHNLFAQLEVDLGRTVSATVRLLERLRHHPRDPDLYAALVHALRYGNLLEESLAAHRRARRLDRGIPTSVQHTFWMLGSWEQALGETYGDIGYMPGLALASLGRTDDAIAALRWRERETQDSGVRTYLVGLRAMLEGDRATSLQALDQAAAIQTDPEARYYLARSFAKWGEHDRALTELERVVSGGFFCHSTFSRDPWLDPLRSARSFDALMAQARAGHAHARRAFDAAGGSGLLRGQG